MKQQTKRNMMKQIESVFEKKDFLNKKSVDAWR